MKRILLLLAALCAPVIGLRAQSVALMPVARQQFFDSLGNPLAGGKVYTYSAGTTTPLATYTDSTGASANANPVVLDASGMANIWLSSSAYKIVLKDSSDVTQWTVDNVTTATGGAASGPFTTVTSAGSNPATAGWVRAASTDQQCWRNNGNSANICWDKDANDRLNWGGVGVSLTEGSAPSGTAGRTVLYGDSAAHRLKMSNNNGSFDSIVGLATTDTLTNKTLTSPAITNPSVTGTVSGGATYSTPTLTSPTVSTGLSNNGSGFKHLRITSCSLPGVAPPNNYCSTTFTWTSSFADAFYTPTCTAEHTNGDDLNASLHISVKAADHIDVVLTNAQAEAFSVTINCIAVHD